MSEEVGQMHLERVVIVNEKGLTQDDHVVDFDLMCMEGPLKCSGIADDIDVLAYSDYPENCDRALINYCLQKKPQAVLMSLENIRAYGGGPTPKGVWDITHRLGIPTVLFWFSIYSDSTAELLESYSHSVTLNMIGGADASSHKPMALEGTNYVYAGVTWDEHLFNMPEGVRDIPVGFLGSLVPFRRPWIAGLKKFRIPVYTGGGPANNMRTERYKLSYKEYLKLMSRMKIALSFAMVGARDYNAVLLDERGRVWEALYWLVSNLKTWLPTLAKNPINKSKYIIPVLKNTAPVLLKKPRYMPRARVWEALWLRTFLLEEDNPVTSLYFEPYVDYVPYTTLKDLVDKIKYYLENDEERDRIRMHGRATVEKYYNARIYFENIFEAAGIPSDKQYQHHPGEIWNKAHFENWLSSSSSG